ncbi:endothelin-converting enzyme 1-like isoform X2 [Ornithodoros turicata]
MAVAVTIGAFLYSNKGHETPKEKGNTSAPGHVSMPKFPIKPYDVSDEDYTDNDVAPAESTSPTYKKVCNTDVTHFCEELPDLSGSFVRDVPSIEEFLTERYWKGAENDYGDYFYQVESALDTYQANSFYVPPASFVQISIPFLLSPYFNLGGPPEVNHVSLGYTVAHEMMHGFDINGRRYDVKGDIAPWFTKKSTEEFKILDRCYLEYVNEDPGYGNYTLQKTEYQADILSNESLLRAYLRAAKKSKVHLGNVKVLTSDQIIYVAIAVFSGAKMFPVQPFAAHPPKDQRCDLPLTNFAHSSKTFTCRDGSPMNPPQKCYFW